MKNLQVSFEGTKDTTGYLFSMMKCLSAVCRCSEYKEYADDIIATSGFAFRMWATKDLCPSAMSIWEFRKQKEWVENGGLLCNYVERMWEEELLEEERRLEALQKIKDTIDKGVAAVAWDLGDVEWGIIKGYDEEEKKLITLRIDGKEDYLPYEKLGKGEIPILSVLTVIGSRQKEAGQLLADTKSLAVSHLRGEEWCDNSKGIEAYDTIIDYMGKDEVTELPWELEYYLGTYAALKWYAYKYFEKNQEEELAVLYESIHNAWQEAFEILSVGNIEVAEKRDSIVSLLKKAKAKEESAMKLLVI